MNIVRSKIYRGVADWVVGAVETNPGISAIWDVELLSGLEFQINLNDAEYTKEPEFGDLCVFGFDGGSRNWEECIERAEAHADTYGQPAVQFLGPSAAALMDFLPHAPIM